MPPSRSCEPCQACGHPALRQIDPQTEFLYAPHTVSVLLLGTAISSSSSRQPPPLLPLNRLPASYRLGCAGLHEQCFDVEYSRCSTFSQQHGQGDVGSCAGVPR
jgi:hypothetical protein